MAFKLVEWTPELDLTDFYTEAGKRGFYNNSNQKIMVDCFKNERKWGVFILYKDNIACGSTATHTLDMFGPNAYRICARTCMFPEYGPHQGLLTRSLYRKMIREYQHCVSQFFVPHCIEWCGRDKDLYFSTIDSKDASLRLTHTILCPEMEREGQISRYKDAEYRGHTQTFWKINVDAFLANLNKYERWV